MPGGLLGSALKNVYACGDQCRKDQDSEQFEKGLHDWGKGRCQIGRRLELEGAVVGEANGVET